MAQRAHKSTAELLHQMITRRQTALEEERCRLQEEIRQLESSQASLSSPATRHTSPASLIPLSGTGLHGSVLWPVEAGSLTNQSSPNANGYDMKNAFSQLRLDSSAVRDLMLTMQQATKALSDPR